MSPFVLFAPGNKTVLWLAAVSSSLDTQPLHCCAPAPQAAAASLHARPSQRRAFTPTCGLRARHCRRAVCGAQLRSRAGPPRRTRCLPRPNAHRRALRSACRMHAWTGATAVALIGSGYSMSEVKFDITRPQKNCSFLYAGGPECA